MEIFVYVVTAIVTISWSVWIYLLWGKIEGLKEDSGYRFFVMILPSTFFLSIVFSAFKPTLFIRLDLVALVLYDIVIFLSSVAVLLGVYLLSERFRGNNKRYFVGAIIFQSFVSVIIIFGLVLLRIFPPLLIKMYQLINQLSTFNFFAEMWRFLNPENHEEDLYNFMNKVLIAIFSYIPISIARFVYNRRKLNQILAEFRKIEGKVNQIDNLEKRLEKLENLNKSN